MIIIIFMHQFIDVIHDSNVDQFFMFSETNYIEDLFDILHLIPLCHMVFDHHVSHQKVVFLR